MNIKKLVYKMLTESTGTHFLDSGGTDDRHWQRNQKKSLDDFENEPKVEIDEWYIDDGGTKLDELYPTISIFHFITDCFELDSVCDRFNKKFNVMSDYESEYNFISSDAEKWLIDNEFIVDNQKINTYNYDNYFSQDVLYTRLKRDDDYYYLVSIHNGADVRGGYTDAKLFKLPYFRDWAFESVNVYGTLDDNQISNTYDGFKLRVDDDEHGEYIVTKDSKISIEYYLS